jgi:ribonucleoside-diphosphate reductase beta chain
MLEIQEIVDCAGDISKYYDRLITHNNQLSLFTSPLSRDKDYLYGHKKALWLCLNAVNALEGVRFYVSFACSWAFAEVKKMEGNAKIIKFIARDENIHLAATQQLLKILPKEDPDFAQISVETRDECIRMFHDVVAQEKAWAQYLFKDGSMIGLNEKILCEYVDHIAAKRMGAIGLNGKAGANPLAWTQKWIAGSEVQVAPQETEITSYVTGGVSQDVTEDTFKGFSL